MPSVASIVRTFVDEITAFLEPSQGAGRRQLPFVLVERGDAFECYRNRRRGQTLVSKGPLERLRRATRKLRGQPVELRLDGSRVLTKILQLPAAGRDYLDAIVRHQLDRATPWAADRVVFDYAIATDEPAPEGQMSVRLVATSRDVFERSMARLTAARIKATVVGTSEDPLDRPSAVNLLRSDRAERRAVLRRKVVIGLVAIIVIGLGAGVLTGWQLYGLQSRAAALDTELGAARARIAAATAGTELTAARERLVAEKKGATPMVVLLDRLSSLIPANTYLSELSISDGEVQIAGFTQDAPALIGLLEASDVLSNVRFTAPTMRDPGATQDRFQITAALEPPAVPTD